MREEKEPDEAVRERFVRVVGLPPDESSDAPPVPPAVPPRAGLAAFDPGRRGVRALAVVAALAVVVAGVFAWWARARPEPVAAVVRSSALAPEPSPAPSGFVVVAVAGRVRNPGLVRLPAGSRVADALVAAGGALPGTDLSFLNLARKLVDGELVVIGVTPPPGVVDAGPGAAAGAPAGKVNLNTATATQLEALPGVGPVLAQHIVDYRTKHGGFRSVADLRQVDGVGDTRYAQLKDLVEV